MVFGNRFRYQGHPENALISCKKEILWKFKGGFILVFMFEFQIMHSKRHGALSNEGYACSHESSCLSKSKSYTWCLNKSKCQSFCLRKSKILVQILRALLNFKVDKRFLLKIKQFTDALLNFNRIEECDGRLEYVESSRPGKKTLSLTDKFMVI